jgi:hypothetical protein
VWILQQQGDGGGGDAPHFFSSHLPLWSHSSPHAIDIILRVNQDDGHSLCPSRKASFPTIDPRTAEIKCMKADIVMEREARLGIEAHLSVGFLI